MLQKGGAGDYMTVTNPRSLGVAEGFVSQYKWVTEGAITEQYSDGSALGNEERSELAVSAIATAKRVLFTVVNGTVAVEIRFRSDGNEDDENIAELYASAGADHYTRIATLTVQQGLQLYSGSIYFCDQMAATNKNWLTKAEVIQTKPADNHISRFVLNPHGYSKFCIIASTLLTSSLYVDVRRM